MASVRSVVVATALASSLTPIAQAADLPRTSMPAPPPIQRAVIEDSTSGWYLRGDLGYRYNTIGGASFTGAFPDPTSNSMKSNFALGGGIGFKAGWFRTDLTLDYGLAAKYTGSVATADDTNLKISSLTPMLNAYFDLGTWSGITPYLGGGVGYGRVSTSGYSSTGAPFSPGAHSRWNFAWAGMAGVSYAFTRNLSADLGYRYISLGNARTGDTALGRMNVSQIRAHEFRLGIRWMFGDIFSGI